MCVYVCVAGCVVMCSWLYDGVPVCGVHAVQRDCCVQVHIELKEGTTQRRKKADSWASAGGKEKAGEYHCSLETAPQT